MSLSSQEEKLLGELEGSLEADAYDKELLTKLLKQYKRTAKRLDKIVKLSDMQQMELLNLNKELDRHKAYLVEKTHKISSLLDNSDEGFLSFGPDMKVESEFSAECAAMLGTNDIADADIYDLLFPHDEYLQDLFIGGVTQVFASDDIYFAELFIGLLPKESTVHGKHLNLKYKLIEKNHIMVITSDVTEKRKLEEAVAKERDKLSFVITVIKDKHSTFDTIDSFKAFRKNLLPEIIANTDDTEIILSEIYKETHTYKGVFSQLKFPKTPDCLHEIEDKLSRLKSAGIIDKEILQNMFNAGMCKDALKQDIETVIENVGKDFFKHNGMVDINIKKVKEIEGFAKDILKKTSKLSADKNTTDMLEALSRLSYVPFVKLLQRYEEYTNELAKRLDKEVAPLKIKGGEFPVDASRYKEVAKNMVHLFRNCIDHGIEDAETRTEYNKPIPAKITCHIKESKKNITVKVCDDGRGIDVAKLRAKLGKAAQKLDDDAVLSMIFEDSISTKEEITDLSGRGVGLPALKKAVQKLKGEIGLKTKLHEGTCFKLVIPKSHL